MNRLNLKRSGINRSVNNETKLVSVISGKGGVGKSVIAFNLAETLSRCGLKVLLVDADFSFGNQHIFANVKADFGIKEFYNKELSLKEAIIESIYGFDILPSVNFNSDFREFEVSAVVDMINRLKENSKQYDYLVIDHASGLSKFAAVIAYASDINLLVMIPELTSISDSYGLYKYLKDADAVIDCRLLINRVKSEDEGHYLFSKFCAVSERFLKHIPNLAGYVSEDETIRNSIASQKPISFVDSHCQSSKNILSVAHNTLGGKGLRSDSRYINKSETYNKTAETVDIKE